jgi:hypothetical protein
MMVIKRIAVFAIFAILVVSIMCVFGS